MSLCKRFLQKSHLFRLAPHVIRTGGFWRGLSAPHSTRHRRVEPPQRHRPRPICQRGERGTAWNVCGEHSKQQSAAGQRQSEQAVLASPSKQRPTSSAGFNPPTRAAGAGKGQRGATEPPALADRSLLHSWKKGKTAPAAPNVTSGSAAVWLRRFYQARAFAE